MKIKHVEVIPLQIPMTKPLKWAAGYMDVIDILLVKIIAEDGTFGVAEAIPRPMIYGETQESMYYALSRYFTPLIIGEDSFNLEIIWEKMERVAWNPACKSAIDVALHDMNGKLLNTPVYKMLGGPYRNKVELCWMVGLDTNEEMVKEVKEKAAEGFKAFKIKGGINPDNDIAVVRQLREEIPSNVQLYIDANQRYDKETAYRVLKALENIMDCVEEPLPIYDSTGRKELSQRVNIPIIADDSVFTVADVNREIQLGAVKRIGIKVPRTGFYLAQKMVHLCEVANIKMQILSQGETTLGTVACLHLAVAYKQIALSNEMTAYYNVADSLIKNELTVKDGVMEIIDGPGLGVEVDWERVIKYTVEI